MVPCKYVDPTQVGLTLALAITLGELLSFGMTRCADLQNEMVSVERVIEFSETEPEAPLTVPRKLSFLLYNTKCKN